LGEKNILENDVLNHPINSNKNEANLNFGMTACDPKIDARKFRSRIK
jgi:hypothetical protein